MAKPTTTPVREVNGADDHPRRRRLTAEARKSSILAAPAARSPRPENFATAMDRLAEAWREVADRYGFPFGSPDIAARAVMGMALMLALTDSLRLRRRRIRRGRRAWIKNVDGAVLAWERHR